MTQEFDPAAFQAEHGEELEPFRLDRCPRDLRGGKTDYPYVGRHVWLTPDVPGGIATGALALNSMTQKNTKRGDDGFEMIKTALASCVAGTDVPQWPETYQSPDVWEIISNSSMAYIMGLVQNGEAPEDRPNGSRPGLAGTTIPASSEVRAATLDTPGDLPRHGNG